MCASESLIDLSGAKKHEDEAAELRESECFLEGRERLGAEALAYYHHTIHEDESPSVLRVFLEDRKRLGAEVLVCF